MDAGMPAGCLIVDDGWSVDYGDWRFRPDKFPDPAAMIRGVLNGMAEELYELYELIETGTGRHMAKLTASGNAVRQNRAFQQILEERFHMPLTIVQNEEEAAYGASLCALSALGHLSKRQLPV